MALDQTISLVPKPKLQGLRRKAPQLIAVSAIILVVAVLLIEILEDVLVEGTPVNGGPFGALLSVIISFTRNVTTTISSWGYAGFFGLMILESISLPIPSEVILPFAGYLVSLGRLDMWITIVVATIAGIVGSLIDYYIGLKAAHALSAHRVFGKVFFTPNQLATAVKWFGKYGAVVVFFSRLIPGFRTIVSFPAGAVRMALPKFIAYTTVGCLVWNATLIYVGYVLGSSWTQVAGVSHDLIIAALIAVVAGFVIFMIWRHSKSRNEQTRLKSYASSVFLMTNTS